MSCDKGPGSLASKLAIGATIVLTILVLIIINSDSSPGCKKCIKHPGLLSEAAVAVICQEAVVYCKENSTFHVGCTRSLENCRLAGELR